MPLRPVDAERHPARRPLRGPVSAQLRELGTDARPVIHLRGNTAPLEAQKQPVRPVLTQWAISPRAQVIISHTAAEIVGLELTLVVSTSYQVRRRSLAETLELGGNAVAIDDGTPLQEAVKDPEISTHLDGGNLPMISGHCPVVPERTAQHQCERVALALGGAHVGLRTGRQPRPTIQRMKSAETKSALFGILPT